MGLWRMTAVGSWTCLIALAFAAHFQPLSLLGQSFGSGLEADSGQMCSI